MAGMIGPSVPGSRAIAPPGITQAQGGYAFNASGMPYFFGMAYNGTGGALTKGAVYGLSVSGASATTLNPRLATVGANAGKPQQLVVALEATPNSTWARVCTWGYVNALVEGTVDVTADDALVPVSGQNYLVKAGSGGANSVAEALAGQTANSSVLTAVFWRGEALPLDGGATQYAETSIAAAAILDLADTPVELVPAPGAGKVLEFLGAVLFLDHAGTGFAESADNLVINYENEAGAAASEVIECTGFIDQTADTMTIAVPNGGAATAIVAKAACENKALVLVNPDGDFTDAGTTTSVLRVKTSYRVHVTGW